METKFWRVGEEITYRQDGVDWKGRVISYDTKTVVVCNSIDEIVFVEMEKIYVQ